MAGANVHALNIPLSAFFQQGSSNILSDVVSHEINRNPVATTEINE
jgi:hypothetical protein